jgi:hypothetical protein
MRYLKLYEDFNTDKFKIKDLLEDISALDYILSDEGINAKYFVTEKMASDAPNRYMIGTSDDISSKIDDSFEDVGVYKIQVYFDIEIKGGTLIGFDFKEIHEIADEYYNKLKEDLEDLYDVKVVKEKPHSTGKINRAGDYGLVQVNCVSIIIERQPDDYIYFDDEEDDDINESVDDETAMMHYGIYPEDVKEMFYDLQDLEIFPERLRVFVDFKSMLGQTGNLTFDDPMTAPKMKFQHFPFIEVRVKSEKNEEWDRRELQQRELSYMIEDARFKEVLEVANERLEDYGWKIEKTYKDFRNDYIQIIIKKI